MRRARTLLATLLGITSGALLSAGSARAMNHGNEDLLYLVSDDPLSGARTPWIFFRSPDPLPITRVDVGVYKVEITNPGFTSTDGNVGNVQVTAVGGGTGNYCSTAAWSFSTATLTQTFLVKCYSSASLPADGRFSLSFVRRGAHRAYLLYDTPTAPLFSAPPASSYNPTGATNTVTHLARGWYRVDLPGLSARGMPFITPYKSANRCTFSSWGQLSSASVLVHCQAAFGADADTRFSFLYEELPIRFSGVLAVVDFDGRLRMQASANGSPLEVRHVGTGRYEITVPYRGAPGIGAPMVSGYLGTSCKVDAIIASAVDGGPRAVYAIQCTDVIDAGRTEDGLFSFLLRIP